MAGGLGHRLGIYARLPPTTTTTPPAGTAISLIGAEAAPPSGPPTATLAPTHTPTSPPPIPEPPIPKKSQPPPTPTPQPPYPAPTLLEPQPNASLHGKPRFAWQYPDPLPTSYAFDLRIWSDLYEGNILTVYSLAVCSRNPQVVYAGTEANGVYRSTDGGRTWSPTTLTTQMVRGIAVHPTFYNVGNVTAPAWPVVSTISATWRTSARS